jgi:hypothetical protein
MQAASLSREGALLLPREKGREKYIEREIVDANQKRTLQLRQK